jgi:hypothetical protein
MNDTPTATQTRFMQSLFQAKREFTIDPFKSFDDRIKHELQHRNTLFQQRSTFSWKINQKLERLSYLTKEMSAKN